MNWAGVQLRPTMPLILFDEGEAERTVNPPKKITITWSPVASADAFLFTADGRILHQSEVGE